MTCRVLIVEDNADMAASLTDVLRRELGEIDVIVVNRFAEAPGKIAAETPDVVVLDIFDDQIEEHPEDAVKPAWRVIWNEHFCPVVFHTAHEVPEYQNLKHPFTRYEIKGSGSQGRVASHIKDFTPEIDGLRAVRNELARSAHETLVHVSPLVWQSGKSNAERTDTLLRAVRRRMAATLDHPPAPLNKIHAWEQYICPPIGDSLLTGDILLAISGKEHEPTSYRLVLSPSCDLAIGRPNTLKQVLVADCVPVSEFVEKTRISPQKLTEKLPAELNKDQVAGVMVLPEFSSVLPLMAANLKKLSLLPYADIAARKGETKPFTRIASLDSPFRERLAWAYLQVAGRPGVPDVDVQAVAVAIEHAMKPSQKA